MNNASLKNGYTRKWLLSVDKQRKPFSDEDFEQTFSQASVLNKINELKTMTSTKVAASNRLVDEDYMYSVQITSQYRPHLPMHLLRIELPHSVLGDDSAVCIFVRDQKKPTGARAGKNDYDHTIKHYETMFRTKKIEQSNITFMPLSQFFNEYTTFDQRRKLTYLFDKFMCDTPIATRVNAFLGAKLLQDGRAAFPIDLASGELAEEMDGVLRQVYYQYPQEYTNNKPSIRVGRQSMAAEQVVENIIDLVHQLGSLHPGGSQNIQRLHLRANGNVSTVVDLYVCKDEKAPEPPAEEENITDETETDRVTEPVQMQSHHVVCADHYILYEEDDYSREYEDRVHIDRGDAKKFNADGSVANAGTGVAGAVGAKKTTVLVGGKKVVTAANGQRKVQTAAGSEVNINDLILKSLKKMLGNQNFGGSMGNGNARNMGGGGVTANNAIRKRRVNPQQQQQGGGNYQNNQNRQNNGNRRFI